LCAWLKNHVGCCGCSLSKNLRFLLQMNVKELEKAMKQQRSIKQALTKKQRQSKKNGEEFSTQDSESLMSVSSQESETRRRLEQVMIYIQANGFSILASACFSDRTHIERILYMEFHLLLVSVVGRSSLLFFAQDRFECRGYLVLSFAATLTLLRFTRSYRARPLVHCVKFIAFDLTNRCWCALCPGTSGANAAQRASERVQHHARLDSVWWHGWHATTGGPAALWSCKVLPDLLRRQFVFSENFR